MRDAVSKNQPLVPSVLDRLLDDDPQLSTEPAKNSSQVLRELKQAVRRDLENLLNTRWRCESWPPDLAQLDVSLVNYGIPDFTGPTSRAAIEPDTLFRVIEEAIRNYEPRLRNVRVEAYENTQPLDRTLRFRIDATLYVEPIEEKVWFNSVLEPMTGNFQVDGGQR